jgi:uncharacterized protein YndB with AHSA1/START domain
MPSATPSARHASFTLERRYPVAPAKVFRAWADPERKARWFACHDDWQADHHSLDFRAGGQEHLSATPPGAAPHIYHALYHDIVQGARIIYSYDMHLGATRISVSLATVEFHPEGNGTRMLFTEQAVFLDGYDDPNARDRIIGTEAGFANLEKMLMREGMH